MQCVRLGEAFPTHTTRSASSGAGLRHGAVEGPECHDCMHDNRFMVALLQRQALPGYIVRAAGDTVDSEAAEEVER